jgi:hypothetical protein
MESEEQATAACIDTHKAAAALFVYVKRRMHAHQATEDRTMAFGQQQHHIIAEGSRRRFFRGSPFFNCAGVE